MIKGYLFIILRLKNHNPGNNRPAQFLPRRDRFLFQQQDFHLRRRTALRHIGSVQFTDWLLLRQVVLRLQGRRVY